MKNSSKTITILTLILFSLPSHGEEKMELNVKNEEITQLIEQYAKASKTKFIIDPAVNGKATIFNSSEVSLPDAFKQLSKALALNGDAIVKQGDFFVVRRNLSAQRSNIDVFTELPPTEPTRVITWIVTLKNTPADSQELQQQLRTNVSAYSEIASFRQTNQLIITDWSTNMPRLAQVIKAIDVPQVTSKTLKATH